MVSMRQAQAFHHDVDQHGQKLTPGEREQMLKPYLPRASNQPRSSSPQTSKSPRFHHRQRLRPAIRHIVHALCFHIIHVFFSVYLHVRQIYHALADRVLAIVYYHHRTPELIKRDVKGLSRLPKHLSVILELSPEGAKKDGLETLLNDACEITAWCASAGIPMLSIYERTGMLKTSMPHLRRRIARTLTAYYGANSPHKPGLSLQASNMPGESPSHSPEPLPRGTNRRVSYETDSQPHLTILLIDSNDGRQTLVDLTKTLAEMSQHGKLSPADISTELIDAEISESVMGEPDLLITFGPRVMLEGYPPWQVRLTEIYYAQDHAGGVGYQVFLKALYKYAKAEFRVGK